MIRPETVGCAEPKRWSGRGRPYFSGVPTNRRIIVSKTRMPQLDRQPRVVRELVDRAAEEVLRQDPRAAAGGEERALGDVGGLDRDVHRAVAHPEDQRAPAGEEVAVAVVVGVDLRAGERLVAGEHRLRPARVPVVAVGDDERVEALDRPVRELEVPDAVRAAAGVRDGRLEADRVADAEVVDVGVEVRRDLRVVRVVGIAPRHREVRELHPVARGVDVQPAVGGRHPVAVAEDPVAADAVRRLEAP